MFAGHAILYRELIWFGIVAPVLASLLRYWPKSRRDSNG